MLLFRDLSHLTTKKWKSVKKRTNIEDEVDDYDDVGRTKLSPEQESNKPKPYWDDYCLVTQF
jgi:hypothetical protein